MKKIIIISLCVLGIMVLVGFVLAFLSSQPLSKSDVINKIQTTVEKSIGKNNVTGGMVFIDSNEYKINQSFTAGNFVTQGTGENQPFHTASVGKAFTATLIGCLIDDGMINLDDKVVDYLGEDLLSGLFVFENVDYRKEVTIRQLLNHTSGIADYFEDETNGTPPMKERVLDDKDKKWSPNDLLDFTRNYQIAVSKPGETFHYSDTGYILLGLLIEEVSQMSFDEMLTTRIFEPLNMNDSYLMFYSEPKNDPLPLADVWFEGVNIKNYSSLSIDWAGGGICSTAKDLAIFIRALNNGEIIRNETLQSLYQFDHKFINGIQYGNGFMEYHFAEFFPTLSSIPNYIGHMGVLGTQMFYNKQTDTVYISSFGSIDYTTGSVQTMINILSILHRIQE